MLNRDNEFIQIYQKIVGLKESEFTDHRNLATQLVVAHRYDEAVLAAKEMVRKFPNNAQAWEELGWTYGITNRRDEQIAAYKRAVALAPDRASGHSTLGFGYYISERYEEAIQAFLEAIRLEPQGSTYSSLGKAYAKLGRYREALDSFSQAALLSPDDPEILESLGDFHSELGYYAKAIEAYSKAIEASSKAMPLSPERSYEGRKPRLHYLLGKCYLDLGNRPAALAEYKTLKSLDAEYAQLLFDSIYK